ncbi:MAG: GAF domain-containing protein [Cyanobacteriota bacterium]|jgi:PAS domain S-box-containing protein
MNVLPPPQTVLEKLEQGRQQALLALVRRARDCLSLEALFGTTVAEVRNLLATDRAAIYRFTPGQNWQEGEFIAESVQPPFNSLMGYRLWDHCFSSRYYEQYRQGRLWVMADLARLEAETCHRQLLASLGLQANVVAPLIANDDLWGLFTVHQCQAPREWKREELAFIEHLALHLGLAIQQSQLLSQQREQSQRLAELLERRRVSETILDQIGRCTNLSQLFASVVEDVGRAVGADRALIVRWGSPSSGQGSKLLAEACFNPASLSLAPGERRRVDWRLLLPGDGTSGPALAVRDCEAEISDPVQRQLLQSLGIGAFLNLPLLEGAVCWGVLSLQSRNPRIWAPEDQEFCQKIALHLGIALHQRHLLIQAKNKAASLETLLAEVQTQKEEHLKALQREKALGEVLDRIRQTLELETLFQVTATEIQHLLQVDRVSILQFDPDSDARQGQFISEALAVPQIASLLGQRLDPPLSPSLSAHFQRGLLLALDDTEERQLPEHSLHFCAQFHGRAYLVVPLLKNKQIWGLLCIHQADLPRVWRSGEIEFILKIALHLGVALQQAELLQETQQRSEELQKALAQVEAQKDNLARIAQEERALARVINQIRQTLNLNTIFKTTTAAVRHLLNCDRVLVYRFEEDWSGVFIYEAVSQMWPSLLEEQPNLLQWQDTYLQETQGGRYRRQESWVLDDVESAGLTDCHLEILRNFQVRACAVVPVFVGAKLWGLLGVYQNNAPRRWQEREIHLLEQVANQLGIAVYQAQLLEKTRVQSRDLESALADMTAIIDNLADGLLVTDIFGRITRFNPALLSLFGLEGIDLRGARAADFFPEIQVNLLEKAERQTQPEITALLSLREQRQGQALATSVVKPAQGAEGAQCLGSVVLIRDVTKEREIERMKTDFLATVSHELRTPLTSVLGFAAVIQSKLETVIFPQLDPQNPKLVKTAEKIETNLEIIIQESERLTALINDVLDIAKMEAGAVEWSFSPCQLEPIIHRAIATLTPLFELKNLELFALIPEALPPIRGDEDRLFQVILNLLSNALKFTEKGGVTCEATVLSDALQVSIKDTGAGIASDDLEKIFQPFQQGGEVLTNKPAGTGLGLPICKQIVEGHGGQIWVESQFGQGSQFCFTLPLDTLS